MEHPEAVADRPGQASEDLLDAGIQLGTAFAVHPVIDLIDHGTFLSLRQRAMRNASASLAAWSARSISASRQSAVRARQERAVVFAERASSACTAGPFSMNARGLRP